MSEQNETVNVRECSSCGAVHNGVIAVRYVRPLGAYTHWFVCPVYRDPVNVRVEVDGSKINQDLLDGLARAHSSGRYMVGIWHIDEKNALQHSVFTEQFPTADFGLMEADEKANQGVLPHFRRMLNEVAGVPHADGPMAEAPPRRPFVNLFGSPGEL